MAVLLISTTYCKVKVATIIKSQKKKKKCYSTTILQYFYNKSHIVSFYWFKFETNTKITFLSPTIITSNNLPLRICCKNVVDISFLKKKK